MDLLLIGIVTKNVKPHIEGVIKNIETYINCGLFKDYRVLFVDGNSDDGTYQIAKKWCDIDKNKREIKKQLTYYLIRPLNLQYARNMYMEHFEPYFKKGTYMLLIDADEVNSSSVDIDGFKSCFNYSDWDFMGANQSKNYYDIWTLRSDECPYDCWEMVRKTGDMNYVNKHHKHISKDNQLVPVYSAFGGTGIYHTEKLKGIRYNTFREDYIEQCDHVHVNKELVKRGGKLFINPAFINL